MNLQQILDDIDSEVPNSFTPTQKVRWINETQRRLYRRFTLPDRVDHFQTTAGIAFYSLPDNCPQDRITVVTVDNVPYKYKGGDERAPYCFYTFIQGQIMIYPMPDRVVDVLIYHEPRPKDLDPEDLQTVPEFPEDYHRLLVLGAAIECAKRLPDVTMANNLTADFTELTKEADEQFGDNTPFIVDERW